MEQESTNNLQQQAQPLTSESRLLTAALLAITLVAYIPAMRAGFIWDDDIYVENNQTLRSLDGLRQIWFEPKATPQYYPMVHTSYWLEYRLWDLNPAGYHTVNILLHSINAVLLFRLLSLLGIPGAFLAAAVFAIHPVHVESVAWITERKNTLSTLFYFLSALTYLRFATPGEKSLPPAKSVSLYLASFALFVCALLSKTVTCTLPAAILLILWWKKKNITAKDVFRLIPFFLVGLALGVTTAWLEKYRVGAAGEDWQLSLMQRCLLAGRVICFYAFKLIWPAKLSFVYPRWQLDTSLWWQYLFPAAVLTTIAAFWRFQRRIGTGPLVAVLFFAGTLTPALGFFDVYPMRFSFVADHFQYLASIGLIALAAAVLTNAAKRLNQTAPINTRVFMYAAVLLLGVLSFKQCIIYADSRTLWQDTLKKNPNAWIAWTNLGLQLTTQGKHEQSVNYYRKALEIKPDEIVSLNDMAMALHLLGRSDEAIACFQKALLIEPDYADAHNNFGYTLESQGNLDEAMKHYRRALEISPNNPGIHSNLANALAGRGDRDQAMVHYRRALELKPDSIRTCYNMAAALQSDGNLPEAVDYYRRAFQLDPDHFKTLDMLARILSTSNDPNLGSTAEALDFAQRAAGATSYQDPTALEILAWSYAADGKAEKAADIATRALDLADPKADKELTARLKKQLQLYKKQKP